VRCWKCVEWWCVAVFDHRPTDEEIKSRFCMPDEVEKVATKLEHILNRDLDKTIDVLVGLNNDPIVEKIEPEPW